MDAMPDDWEESHTDEGEQQEITSADAEVIEESNPHLSADVEALSTFSEQEGPLSIRILPVIEGGQTDWRVLVYMSGTQGPVYQSRDGLTDIAASEFGISSRLQGRINDALAYAKDELEVPDGLGDQKRQKRSLHELEVMMGE